MVGKIITWIVSLLERYGYKVLTNEEYQALQAVPPDPEPAPPKDREPTLTEIFNEWLNGEVKV